MNTSATPVEIRNRISHILTIYPGLSPSMIQTGLGNLAAKTWKPVLEAMIEDGSLDRTEIVAPTPSGQHRCYIRISLNTEE